MIINNTGKNFEKPDAGLFVGVLADVVDLGLKDYGYGPKLQIRLVWILNAKDKEGNYYRVATQATGSLNEKARLYKIVRDILDAAPPVPFDIDFLIGKVNQLLIVREKSADGTKEYANVKAIIPATEGTVFAIPQGFIREKDKKQGTGKTTPALAPQAPAAAASVDTSDDIPF
ncbi:MAG: hypothetical protein ACREQ5_09110 [Candidatus Dormibacteria bacterium]